MDLDLRHSVITGLSCWLAALLAFSLQCDNPWWAVISAWIVSGPDPRASLLKAALRVVGTVGAYVVGWECVRQVAGNPVGEATAMLLIGTVGTYQRFSSRFSYAWVIGSVTALMLMVMAIEDPVAVHQTAHYRVYEIIAGVLAATVCQRLLGPLLGVSFGRRDAPAAATQETALAPAQKRELLATALIGGTLPGIIMLLWSRLNLPSPLQIVITAYVTIDRDVVVTRLRASQRILGCLVGGLSGLLAVLWGTDSFVLWSLLLIGGLTCLSRLHLAKSHPWSYVGTQGGVAFILALVTGNQPPDSILPVINRIAGMISGVLILNVICFAVRCWNEKLQPDAAVL